MDQNKESVQNQEGSHKPKGWKAFFLRTYHPRPSVKSTIALFIFLGIIFLIFGIILFVLNNRIVEVPLNYTSQSLCNGFNTYCTSLNIQISEDMNPPVFVFYELHNFYQNHRRYIKSKSQTQLAGETISTSVAETNCDPVVYNGNLSSYQLNGQFFHQQPLNPNLTAYPCGLIAKSFFTDQFKLLNPAGIEIVIDSSDIAWPGDIGKKFKNQKDNSTQWIDVTDPHFVVWMRTAGLPDFRKLWGKINQKLTAGTYTVQIDNTYQVKGNFNGDKIFVLSTSGPFGGKNVFLATAYVVIGAVCFIVAIIFFVKNHMNKNFGYDEKDK